MPESALIYHTWRLLKIPTVVTFIRLSKLKLGVFRI